MQIDGRAELGHLSYCTNIHAGEDWSDVMSSLRECVPPIKRDFSPDGSFGLGLRLGAAAVDALQTPAALQELQSFLQQHDCYVFTINGFPYGPFHGQAVKERVYAPDWQTAERLQYTNQLATILATVLGEQTYGTISTVPGSFKPWVDGQESDIAQCMVQHVAHLLNIRLQTGKTLVLALEPEPFCLLETIAETVEFFNQYLFGKDAISQLQSLCGLSAQQSEAALREHLGVCYDVCHAAVEFEDPAQSIAALKNAGIAIAKVQLSSAMRIPRVTPRTPDLLQQFVEPVYLHQVIESTSNGLRRFVDLSEALASLPETDDAEWRIHFHVPVFLESMQHVDTTQSYLKEILALHRQDPISSHLEVETYTWDVLPEEYRGVDVSTAITRELNWVREQLVG